MSFINIGDIDPNHNLEVQGKLFISNIENGTNVPLELTEKLRFRNKPPGYELDEYKFTDMYTETSNLFGITGPSTYESRSITDFCIDDSSNIGIGTIPTTKLDVQGSIYATGILKTDSNLVTETLTSMGNISCNSILYGPSSNIYGLLPSGVILMTTLTTTPNGWTDITSNFIDKNLLLAETQPLVAAGNDNVTINNNIQHNHGWITEHSVGHIHSFNAGTITSNGHSHGSIGGNYAFNTNALGNHTHGINIRTDEEGHTAFSSSLNTFVPRFGTISNYGLQGYYPGYHDHGTGNIILNNHSYSHNHYMNTAYITESGGNHTHTLNNQGNSTTFSIIPKTYGLRFIKKN